MQKNSTARKIPALDGLRGWAVLIVLFYHGLNIPSGGSVGVEIFFVLSGYLITSHITSQIKSGIFSFWFFFSKRVRRIFPAFIAVCIIGVAIKWAFPNSPSTLNFWKAFFSLFDGDLPGVSLGVLGHVWSLAVEWQFYCVWPFFVMTFWLCTRGYGLALIASLCLSFFLWYARLKGSEVPPYDHLLLGAAVAFFVEVTTAPRLDPRVWRFMALLALAAIGWLVFFPLGLQEMPWTLWVSAFTTVLIYCCLNEDGGIAGLIMQNPLLRYFGKISYGLYLYHFPIMSLMYVNGFSRSQIMVGGMLVAIPLADFSWRFYEKPIIQFKLSDFFVGKKRCVGVVGSSYMPK